MERKNIAIFLDGTWNEPTSNTNVWRAKILLKADAHGRPQLAYYGTGVGTAMFERVRGGAFAKGLSQNVRQAYQWLMENYDDGDDVFLFGFSRGAFTARSLAGMIARCGLLKAGAPLTVVQMFDLYERGDETKPLYELEYEKRNGRTDFARQEALLLEYSARIPIKFIGVWDTVGTLGVPLGNIPGLSSRSQRFHHTRWSVIYENVAHALAVDENRKPYMPVMLFDFVPEKESATETREKAAALAKRVEQRWFSGAHSNVGGGYENDLLAQLPLAWIMNKAHSLGLRFKHSINLSGAEHREPVIDSYAQFLKGAYRLVTFGRRYYRPIGVPPKPVTKGTIVPINEVIDKSVFARWQHDENYRPKNLEDWARRTGKNIAGLYEDQTA